MTDTSLIPHVFAMVCSNDPEGGEILRSYYFHNTEKERTHFIDAVIQKINDKINFTLSIYENDESADPEQYVEFDRAQLAVVHALKDVFIKTGRASQHKSFIEISAFERPVIILTGES